MNYLSIIPVVIHHIYGKNWKIHMSIHIGISNQNPTIFGLLVVRCARDDIN